MSYFSRHFQEVNIFKGYGSIRTCTEIKFSPRNSVPPRSLSARISADSSFAFSQIEFHSGTTMIYASEFTVPKQRKV